MRIKLAVALMLALAVAPGAARAAVGSIQGVARDAAGAPVHGICVDATSLLIRGIDPALERGSAVTGADGSYVIDGLLPGTYRVHFHECWNNAGPLGSGGPPPARHESDQFAQQWWPRADREEEAGPVLVAGPAIGIDAALKPHPGIAGTVTGPAGEPLANIAVSAVSPEGDEWRGTTTGPDGRYKVLMGPDEADPWTITFTSPGHSPQFGEYVQEWYDDASAQEDAQVLAYVPGSILGGIDARLARSGTITGSVTDARGEPLETCVEVVNSAGVQVAEVTSHGTFTAGGLATGTYKVRVRDCHLFGYADGWFGGDSFATATPIEVVWGEVSGGAHVVLRDGGSISGRLTAPSGAPHAGWHVMAEDVDERYAWTALTEADGTWHMGTLVPSTAIVSFHPPEGTGPVEWYDDSPTRAGATPVAILAETETAGIDAVI